MPACRVQNLLAFEGAGGTMGSVSIRGIYQFYRDGFREMTLGRVLWGVILVKLVVIFVVLRVFFFSPHLQGTEAEKIRAVTAELTERK